jgi:predicted small metal-binding protein
MKTLSCREAGFDCDYIVNGETEEEIFQKGGEHAITVHGMKEEELTPEFQEKLRGLIRTAE